MAKRRELRMEGVSLSAIVVSMRLRKFEAFPLAVTLLFAAAVFCRAEWRKDITCPAGTEYRDLRSDAGRQEFCEKLLPGSLRVKHGPYHSWFSEGHFGSEGRYENGRRVGLWTECDRFGRCSKKIYNLSDPEEERRPGFQPKIPVWYANGKYVFDFTSCWSTWVEHSGEKEFRLNIGGYKPRCEISYLPEQFMEHGGGGDYTCEVPYSVGKRLFSSLDLRSEFPKLGLPQFCHTSSQHGEAIILVDRRFIDFAYTGDLQCATVQRSEDGRETLEFTLIPYVSELTVQLAQTDGPLIGRLCLVGPDQKVGVSHASTGKPVFSFALSSVTAERKKQEKCLSQAVNLKPACP